MREVLLGIKPFPQPHPTRDPGGDCGPCALKSIIDHLYPDRPVAFEATDNLWQTPAHGGGTIRSPTWLCAHRHLPLNARELGYDIEAHILFRQPTFDTDHFPGEWWTHMPMEGWTLDLEAYLSAGWVGLVPINAAGSGPQSPDGKWNGTDRWVVIDGVRQAEVEYTSDPGNGPTTWKAKEYEVHVVCSARGTYWIGVRQFLMRHGAAGVILYRRA